MQMKKAPGLRMYAAGIRSTLNLLRFSITIGMIAVSLGGCAPQGVPGAGVDTCTSGDNMSDPRLAAGLEELDGGVKIRLTWDSGTGKGAQLPAGYFQAVALSSPPEIVRSAALTAEREITIEFNDLTSFLQTSDSLELSLEFPDRREYISCSHAGMDDRYFLKIILGFTEGGSLEDVQFEQGVRLGPI
jgi:hypothetical protein